MPSTKNASFRYRVLDQCFQNRSRQWTLVDLIKKVSQELEEQFGISKGVSRRQIQEDINIMRSEAPRGFDAPIVCKNSHYYYEDSSYSIMKRALNLQDLNNLNEALELLRQFRGLPHFQDIERILLKMEGKVQFNDPEETIISFEQIDLTRGYEFIAVLYKAIKDQKTQVIEYLPFQRTIPSILIVHPYYLKEYRGRWYVFGWVQEHGKITNLALDRILNLKESYTDFLLNTSFNPQTYFESIVGVTRADGNKIQTIKIKADALTSAYLRSKPIHLTQTEEKISEDFSIFTYTLIPNFEFEAELLRLGEAIVVIMPISFREKIEQRLLDALKMYKIKHN